MKRWFLLFICLMLLCAPALADAISIDLETATLEELLALREQVNARILETRGAREIQLTQGAYTVGSDVAAGEYRMVCAENVESAFVYVYAPDSENWYNYDHFYALGNFHACMEVGKVTLEAGAKLDIQGANVALIPYTAVN